MLLQFPYPLFIVRPRLSRTPLSTIYSRGDPIDRSFAADHKFGVVCSSPPIVLPSASSAATAPSSLVGLVGGVLPFGLMEFSGHDPFFHSFFCRCYPPAAKTCQYGGQGTSNSVPMCRSTKLAPSSTILDIGPRAGHFPAFGFFVGFAECVSTLVRVSLARPHWPELDLFLSYQI